MLRFLFNLTNSNNFQISESDSFFFLSLCAFVKVKKTFVPYASRFHMEIERGAFSGLVFLIVGDLSKSHAQISRLISLHGGEIALSMAHTEITHIASTMNEIRKRDQLVSLAKDRDILIVAETYLLACIEARRRLPEQKFILRDQTSQRAKAPSPPLKRTRKGPTRGESQQIPASEKRRKTLSNYLNDLCYKGDTEEVLRILQGDEQSASQQSDDGETPLHCAAEGGHIGLAETLIARGGEVNARTKFGTTPLHCASWQGDTKMISFLLSQGSNLGLENTYGEVPLHCAAREGHANVVNLLLQEGANINGADWFGGTALSKAADRGHLPVVEFLLSQGADTSTRNWKGLTARDLAELKEHASVVEEIDKFLSRAKEEQKQNPNNNGKESEEKEKEEEPQQNQEKKETKRTRRRGCRDPPETPRFLRSDTSLVCSRCTSLRLRCDRKRPCGRCVAKGEQDKCRS